MKRNQSGFTLIEIAIVLVIIGLLLGGVLKGQELINSAKVKNLATDFRNIPVFIYGYQDKFKSLPGDDATLGGANTHIPGANACGAAGTATASCTPGNGLINGTWNDYSATSEAYLFWQHVRLAGLTSGPTTIPPAPGAGDGFRPVNAAGGEIGIQSGTAVAGQAPVYADAAKALPIRGTYIICSPNVLGKFAKQLDIQLDDGNTAGGSMMAFVGTAIGSVAVGNNTAAWDDAAVYTVCMGV